VGRCGAFVVSVLAIGLLAGQSLADVTSAIYTTFTPKEDATALLHNPDMGWVLYENYPLDQRPGGSSTLVNLPAETFPEVDEVALMFSWQDIEKSKDNYDFSNVDFAYDYWKSRGKRIQLRMSTESLLWWSNLTPASGKGIPDYVLDAVPATQKQTRTCEGLSYVVVDARDPYYQDRLGRFLQAVGKHFRTRPVTLIDLRGFGLWGEWHSGYRYNTVDDRVEALRKIIDCWSANLRGYTLAISYSYDPDGPPEYYSGSTQAYSEKDTAHYADFLRYSAFDYALTKPNIVLRRDGVGGAVHSNERRLIRDSFETLPKGTMVCEFCGGYSAAKKGGDKWVQFMMDDALSLHPNYINLLGWQSEDALSFCRERPDLIKLGLLNMGYRLVPVEISVPTRIQAGSPFEFRSLWANRAAGCATADFTMKLLLTPLNSRKTTLEVELGPLGTSKWTKGRYYAVNKQLALGEVPPGAYDLSIELTDPRTGKPIELPLVDVSQPGHYRIGRVEIIGRP